MGVRRAGTTYGHLRPPPSTTDQATTAGRVVVRRVGESAWVLRPSGALEDQTVDVLRDAFLEAVDSGAENLVVDLSDVDSVAAKGAETILAMVDLMRGRNGVLWLAARSSDGEAHTLRAIDARESRSLLGVIAALDAALELLPIDGRGHRQAHDGA